MDLKGKNFIVTGGSLGIGKETARLLIKKGANVLITGRDQARLDKAAKELNCISIKADVALAEDVKKTYNCFFEHFNQLHGLINNAGIGYGTGLTELDMQKMIEVFNVNVFGAAMMAKEAAVHFKEKNEGNIINISSTSGLKGHAKGTAYSASKFALRGMTECWRAELRPYNVRVMLINPSEVATAFGSPDRVERTAAANKLRSEEIAHAVISILEMDQRGFIPELSVWATNPWE